MAGFLLFKLHEGNVTPHSQYFRQHPVCAHDPDLGMRGRIGAWRLLRSCGWPAVVRYDTGSGEHALPGCRYDRVAFHIQDITGRFLPVLIPALRIYSMYRKGKSDRSSLSRSVVTVSRVSDASGNRGICFLHLCIIHLPP